LVAEGCGLAACRVQLRADPSQACASAGVTARSTAALTASRSFGRSGGRGCRLHARDFTAVQLFTYEKTATPGAPVTRRRIALTRLAVVFTQISAFTILPSLLLCAMAPLRGQHYPVEDALVHSLILLVSGLSLFGLTMFLRLVMNDVAAYTAAGALVVICVLFTFIAI
jgi:hypothetical protein